MIHFCFVTVTIANAACLEHGRQHRAMLTVCGCQDCTHSLRWLEGGQLGSPITPCRILQVATKLARGALVNTTPTFFRQCIHLHSAMPATHPLLASTLKAHHSW